MRLLILLVFLSGCGSSENSSCEKKYQEIIVDCKLGVECKRVLVEICE